MWVTPRNPTILLFLHHKNVTLNWFRPGNTSLPRTQKIQSWWKEHPTPVADAARNQKRRLTASSPHPLTFLPFRRTLLKWGWLLKVPEAAQQSEQSEVLQLRDAASQQLQKLYVIAQNLAAESQEHGRTRSRCLHHCLHTDYSRQNIRHSNTAVAANIQAGKWPDCEDNGASA
jgi:hypothetical protein